MQLIDRERAQYEFERYRRQKKTTECYEQATKDVLDVMFFMPEVDPVHAAGAVYCFECESFGEIDIDSGVCNECEAAVSKMHFCASGKAKEARNDIP